MRSCEQYLQVLKYPETEASVDALHVVLNRLNIRPLLGLLDRLHCPFSTEFDSLICWAIKENQSIFATCDMEDLFYIRCVD